MNCWKRAVYRTIRQTHENEKWRRSIENATSVEIVMESFAMKGKEMKYSTMSCTDIADRLIKKELLNK